MSSIKLFSGTSNPSLARGICKYLNIEFSDINIERFPDGEIGVQIKESIRGDDVFIVQSTNNPANDNFMELFIMIDTAKRASAGRVTAVLPFFGYARQDRKDKSRVPITAKLIANLLVKAGADRVLTMDMHSQQLVGFFDIPVDHLQASTLFIRHIRGHDTKNLTICSPDFGSAKMAIAYANVLGSKLAMVAKLRRSGSEVDALNIVGDINGRNILLVDDMTVTGKTLVEASKLLKKNGAKSVKAAVSHCLLTEDGFNLIKKSDIDEFITTNSTNIKHIGKKFTVLSTDEMFGEAIRRTHENNSLSSLFEIQGF